MSALAMQMQSNAALNAQLNFGLGPNPSLDSEVDLMQSDLSSNQNGTKLSNRDLISAIQDPKAQADFDPLVPLVSSQTDTIQAHPRLLVNQTQHKTQPSTVDCSVGSN